MLDPSMVYRVASKRTAGAAVAELIANILSSVAHTTTWAAVPLHLGEKAAGSHPAVKAGLGQHQPRTQAGSVTVSDGDSLKRTRAYPPMVDHLAAGLTVCITPELPVRRG
jgi:hypothetical protein